MVNPSLYLDREALLQFRYILLVSSNIQKSHSNIIKSGARITEGRQPDLDTSPTLVCSLIPHYIRLPMAVHV